MTGTGKHFAARRLQLISSGKVAGWTCSHCAWKWSLQDSSGEQSGLTMRHMFATHSCEEFSGGIAAGSSLRRTRIAAWMGAIATEERFAVLLTTLSMIWTVEVVTAHFVGIAQISLLPPGPAEVCAIGALVWLHAKWRQAMDKRLATVPCF